MKAAVGLADLARLFHRLPAEHQAEHAVWLGFRAPDPPALLDEPTGDRRPGTPGEIGSPAALIHEATDEPETRMPFWRIEAAIEREPPSNDEEPAGPSEPGLTWAEIESPGCRLSAVPPSPPLAPWSTLWSRLRTALHGSVASREPDVGALVRSWARGDGVGRIPRLARRSWAAAVTLWVDRSERLIPFWRDQDEGPQHWVTITRGYWLGETPVTQALWRTLMTKNPSRFVSDDRPVEQASWDDCQAFIDRLNQGLDGLATRLPTEAEWERACRAGTTGATWVGDLTLHGENDAPELDAIAWYGGNSGVDFELHDGHDTSDWPEKQYPQTQAAGTHPVGRKAPNPYGLHDMLGNVFEWCQDAADDYTGHPYRAEPALDPVSPSRGPGRVIRGGSWDDVARHVRAAYRDARPRDDRVGLLGFRLAGGQASAPGKSRRPDGDATTPRRNVATQRPRRVPEPAKKKDG